MDAIKLTLVVETPGTSPQEVPVVLGKEFQLPNSSTKLTLYLKSSVDELLKAVVMSDGPG